MFFNQSKKLLKQKEQELNQAMSIIANYEERFKDLTNQNSISKELLLNKAQELESAFSKIMEQTKHHEELGEKVVSFQELVQQREFEMRSITEKITNYDNEYGDITSKIELLKEKEKEIQNKEQKLSELNNTYKQGIELHTKLEAEIALYEESLEISSYGLYTPRFFFDVSEKYRDQVELNYEKQKQQIKDGDAVVCNTEWTVSGSKAEGRKMTNQYKKLMLYAFNGECDSLISKVKWNNVNKAKERILKAFEAINKLGVTHNTWITSTYLNLKLDELALTYEYEQKKYEEKEEQRLIREQMREEEKAQRELEKAQKEAEDEERRFQKALEKAQKELTESNGLNATALSEQVKELERKLQEAQEKKERAIAQAQLTKVGHIYVISNVGSFGEDVYKIGMTRRLDPMDRVKELGDASVPFQFDVHAIIYSDNAPQLEYELHRKFGDRRMNRVNHRKEFFRVSLDEIEGFVKQHTGAEMEFTKLMEAREYRETITMLQQLESIAKSQENISNFPASLI